MTGLSRQTEAKINGGTSEDSSSLNSENNNSLADKNTIDTKMVTCPVCGSQMRREGEIQQPDPLNILKKKQRLLTIYYCNRCGYKVFG
jgi:predicted nucleic-acid-binding Zn-ribbon protein